MEVPVREYVAICRDALTAAAARGSLGTHLNYILKMIKHVKKYMFGTSFFRRHFFEQSLLFCAYLGGCVDQIA